MIFRFRFGRMCVTLPFPAFRDGQAQAEARLTGLFLVLVEVGTRSVGGKDESSTRSWQTTCTFFLYGIMTGAAAVLLLVVQRAGRERRLLEPQ
jgi:hypothetical protein